MSRIDSYDLQAHTPAIGSRWVWEVDTPQARAIIEVIGVKWNGEEWWVRTRTLLPNFSYPPAGTDKYDNDLSRFAEAVTPVGAALPHTWVYRAVRAGTEQAWSKDD